MHSKENKQHVTFFLFNSLGKSDRWMCRLRYSESSIIATSFFFIKNFTLFNERCSRQKQKKKILFSKSDNNRLKMKQNAHHEGVKMISNKKNKIIITLNKDEILAILFDYKTDLLSYISDLKSIFVCWNYSSTVYNVRRTKKF